MILLSVSCDVRFLSFLSSIHFILTNIKNSTTLKVKLRNFKSSRPDVFCEKGVLRNFAKFTGKHLCQRLFIKKESLAQVFSCEF